MTFDAVTWGASILYGGVVEELMMRLFFMTLTAFIAWKLFFRKEEAVPVKVLIAANIIAALAFAAGHLPSTITLFGALTPMIVFRCFLLNGAFGLIVGRLYRNYGIQYAMLSHALLHIVSKTIWLLLLYQAKSGGFSSAFFNLNSVQVFPALFHCAVRLSAVLC
ncbi:MAG: CPBP family intramembrane metalloprotease [Clostridia bacterium]|nr:CPBP family intramembrane metalloprotease [Clostridia bacterium]